MSKDGEQGVSIVTDHPFEPRDTWWSRCVCGLAESAHATTTLTDADRAYGDTPPALELEP